MATRFETALVIALLTPATAFAQDAAQLQRQFEAGQFNQVVASVTPASPPEALYSGRRATRSWALSNRPRRPSAGWPNVPKATRGTSSACRDAKLVEGNGAAASRRRDGPWPRRPTCRPRIFSSASRSLVSSSWAEAAAAFDGGSERQPANAYAHYYGGMAYYRASRVDRMAVHFEQFLKLAPEAPERPEVMSIMKTLRR